MTCTVTTRTSEI